MMIVRCPVRADSAAIDSDVEDLPSDETAEVNMTVFGGASTLDNSRPVRIERTDSP